MKQHSNHFKYFLYARKSTESEDRQVASIDSQIDHMKKDAEREELKMIEILSEARSAKVPGRPVFNEMIQRIRRGEAQGIICWKLDRLARNPVDAGQISWMLQQGLIQHIRTHERDYYPSDNVLMMSVEFGMANQYVRDLSVSVARGMRDKAKRGWHPTKAPLGYLNERNAPKGMRPIINDPDRFALMRKAFDLMLTGGYTAPQVLQIVTDEWNLRSRSGKKLSVSNIYAILRNPFYYGAFEYPKASGQWYQGAHEPMITPEEYDRIQVLLGRKGRQRPKSHTFAFTGVMRCARCTTAVTAEEKFKYPKNGKTHRYVYYHCTKKRHRDCPERSVEEKQLLSQILRIIESLAIPQEFYAYALDWFRQECGKDIIAKDAILKTRQQAAETCSRKLDRLIDMRAAEQITEDEFVRKRDELLREKAQYQARSVGNADELKIAEEMMAFLQKMKTRITKGTEEQRREVLLALGSNHRLSGQNLFLELQKPLIPMKKAVSVVRRIHRRLEPRRNGLTQRQMDRIYRRLPVVWTLLHEVRTAIQSLSGQSPFRSTATDPASKQDSSLRSVA